MIKLNDFITDLDSIGSDPFLSLMYGAILVFMALSGTQEYRNTGIEEMAWCIKFSKNFHKK